MSVSESVQLAAPTTTRVRSGLAPLLVVLALGLAVLVLLLATSTAGSTSSPVAGTHATPHIAR